MPSQARRNMPRFSNLMQINTYNICATPFDIVLGTSTRVFMKSIPIVYNKQHMKFLGCRGHRHHTSSQTTHASNRNISNLRKACSWEAENFENRGRELIILKITTANGITLYY